MGLTAAAIATVAHRPSAQIVERLEAAREVIENRFLEAGEVLSRAVEGVGVLIRGLDAMRENLDADTVASTTGDLTRAADSLRLLPVGLEQRRERISKLVNFSDGLCGCIDEMRQHLAYLRVFAINIKITSGGISAAGAEFSIFAQEISDCIELGRSELDVFADQLSSLDTALRGALKQEEQLSRDCAGLLPAVPDALAVSAGAIAQHHARIADVAVNVATLARDVQKKVGQGLAALQIGDITRQRIEHVQAGLRYFEETPEIAGLADEPRQRAQAFTHRLLGAQLSATAEDFHRDVSRIGANVAGMAADAAELLRLGDMASDRAEGAETNFLKSLEANVGQALDLVSDVTGGEQAAEAVSRSAAEAVRELTDRIASIQNIRADVQMMALNTTLKCSRIGETGKPLGVIAVELRQHAIHLEKSAGHTVVALDSLFAAAEALGRASGAGDGQAASAASVLGEAVARIGKAGDGVDDALARAASQGVDVVDMLKRAGARFDFQRQIGSVLDQAADELYAMAGEDEIDTADIAPALRPLMTRLAKQYTMVQEREVHRALTEALGDEVAPPAVADAASAEVAPVQTAEDLDDVLF